MHPYAKEQIDSQAVPKSLETDVLLPPNPELKVVYVVPIRSEIQNGNFFFLLRDFVQQTASKADFEALFVVNNSKDDVGSEAFFDNQLILEVLRYIDGVTSTLDVPMKDWERALVERAKQQKLALYAIDFSLQGTFPKSKDGDKIEKARTIGDNVAVSRLNQTKIGGEGAVVVFDADGRLNHTATQGIVEQLVQNPNLEMIKIKYDFIPGEGGPEIFETTSRQRFLVVLMELIHFGKVRVGGWFAMKAKSLGQRDPDVAQPKERDRRHESLTNVQRADNAVQFYTKDRAQDPDTGGLFSILRYFGIHSNSQSLNFFKQNIEHPAFTLLKHVFPENSTQRNNPLVRQFVLDMFDTQLPGVLSKDNRDRILGGDELLPAEVEYDMVVVRKQVFGAMMYELLRTMLKSYPEESLSLQKHVDTSLRVESLRHQIAVDTVKVFLRKCFEITAAKPHITLTEDEAMEILAGGSNRENYLQSYLQNNLWIVDEINVALTVSTTSQELFEMLAKRFPDFLFPFRKTVLGESIAMMWGVNNFFTQVALKPQNYPYTANVFGLANGQ